MRKKRNRSFLSVIWIVCAVLTASLFCSTAMPLASSEDPFFPPPSASSEAPAVSESPVMSETPVESETPPPSEPEPPSEAPPSSAPPVVQSPSSAPPRSAAVSQAASAQASSAVSGQESSGASSGESSTGTSSGASSRTGESRLELPSVGDVSGVGLLSAGETGQGNRQINWIGILSWACIAAGVLIVLIILLSNCRPPRGGYGRKRYRRPRRRKSRLLSDRYYRNNYR